ncbi:MAG: hypothetical protein ACRDRT_01155, partial [Pseudonocardiaceae bacterium]
QKLLCAQDDSRSEGARPLAAFELGADAREEHDQLREAWPAELLNRRLAELRTALEPRVSIEAFRVDSQKADELEALGY